MEKNWGDTPSATLSFLNVCSFEEKIDSHPPTHPPKTTKLVSNSYQYMGTVYIQASHLHF